MKAGRENLPKREEASWAFNPNLIKPLFKELKRLIRA